MLNKPQLISLLFCSLIFFQLNAQSPGDYRSKQSGAWAAAATWETYNGNAWVNAVAEPTVSSGAINILATHTVTASSNITANQVVIDNDGILTISSGIFTLTDRTGTEISCNGAFNFNGGSLTGTGSVEINSGGTFNWNGATINGDITTNINTGAVFFMSVGTNVLGGSANPVINNYGECTWTSGNLNFNIGSPVFNNYGIVNIFTDADVASSNTTTGSFNNKAGGIINKTGSPGEVTYFNGAVSCSNDGIININSGFLRFYVPYVQPGTLVTALGAGAYFTNGISYFTSTSSIAGEGNLFFDGAMATLNSASVSAKNITVSSDTLIVSADISVNAGCHMILTNGVITGSGNINFDDGSTFNWNNGFITGSGTINISGGAVLNLDGGGRYFAQTKIINNYGCCNWTNGFINYYSDAPVFNNYGAFNITGDDVVTSSNNSAGSFVNHPGGVINKAGNPGSHSDFTGTIFVINDGTININSGSIIMQAKSYHHGDIFANPGTSLDLKADTAFMYTGTNVNGDGALNFSGAVALLDEIIFNIKNITISAGTVSSGQAVLVNNGCTINLTGGTLNGQGDIDFSDGSIFNWNDGINGGTGTITIYPGALFNTNGASHYFTDTKKLDNYGTWSWDNGDIMCSGDSTVINNYGIMNINGDDNLFLGSTVGIFNNQPAGDIIKEGITGGYTLINGSGIFNNYGNTDIRSGTFNLGINGEHAGKYDISQGGELTGNIDLLFTGSLFINNGTVTLTNLSFGGSVVQNLTGEGVIESSTINNPIGVVITESQRITHNLTVLPGAKLFVDKDLAVQHD